MKRALYFIAFTCTHLIWSQEKVNSNYEVHIDKASDKIIIDGLLNEKSWKQDTYAKNFFMIQPEDSKQAKQQSSARLTFDDEYLYIAVIFYNNSITGDYNVESYRRDFSFGKNDNLLIALDPFNNQTTGFSFGLNAYGAQWDGTMYNGGKVDLNWDTKWKSAVVFNKEQWVAEIAIPFSVIRYKEHVTTWGINFGRLDLKANEKSAWAPVPKIFPSVSLAYTGNLIWDSPPPKQQKNMAIIPYIASNTHENGANAQSTYIDVGADMKIGIGESMNLDLTLNPDFSNVEVDQEVTNLDRFELFFPEKRQFFLENADLFSNFGYERIRPFFSRRIGLDTPIIGGLRLSGNLSENTRIGLMDIQTKNTTEELSSENFAVLSVQQKIFERSNIAAIFVNKQLLGYDKSSDLGANPFHRTLGMEYNYASSNNYWDGKLLFLSDFSPEVKTDNQVWASHLSYTTNNLFLRAGLERVGAQIDAEVGYIPRVGYYKGELTAGYLSYLKSNNFLVSHGPRLNYSQHYNFSNQKTDQFSEFSYRFNFLNRSNLSLFYNNAFVLLQSPFDPTGLKIKDLEEGSSHDFSTFGFDFQSKPQSLLTYSLGIESGGFFEHGKKLTTDLSIGYRFQPYVSLSAILNFNKIQLAAPWNNNDFWLLGAKSDITFTKNLFFTTIFQRNQQKDLWAFNSRIQWRYKDASDFFIVFNSIENPLILNQKNWSLSFKVNYWFNP